tara:strand:- start:102 stop:458 length:357 start_codon:yes stop_codon:yes gene_type:complete
MSISLRQKEFVEHIVDLSQVIGPVYSKRMFGGYGVFLDGLMFGLIFRNTLYFKVDVNSRDYYISRGLEPFSYERQGKRLNLNYYQAPEEVFDDVTVMKEWCNSAFEAAMRAATKRQAK